MKWLFAVLLLIHGLLHLLGFAKAFGYAELPQLTAGVSRPMGLTWLASSGLFLATLVALFAWPREWWRLGAIAVVVSQIVIVQAWSDAKFGTIANIIVLAGVILGFAAQGPTSFRAEFDRQTRAGLGRSAPQPVLAEADLASLPVALRKYLALTGALGQPRVQNFRLTFKGRIRSSPTAPWLSFTGEQYNFLDRPARFFIMDASMYGVPVQVLHRFEDGSATMRVKVASIFPVVDAKGPEMTKAETVTLFNDMCVFAPGSLIDPRIQWEEIDAQRVGGAFSNAGVTIRAVLAFSPVGELIDFVSDDRLAGSPDGKSFTAMRWSTPLGGYQTFGAHTVAASGAGRWHPAGGDAYDYIQLSLTGIGYNLRTTPR